MVLLLGFFLDFIPNCFLVSYSCTAYKVYSTVVQLFEFNEALPRLQVFRNFLESKNFRFWFLGKKKKKDKKIKIKS